MLKLFKRFGGNLVFVETFSSGRGIESFLERQHGRIDTYGINCWLAGGFQYEVTA
jgi:hypothetical protein